MEFEDLKKILDEFFFGKYELVKFLKSSSFSEIYLIKHVFLEDLRVMKILKKPLNVGSDLNLFLYGARLICQLRHENIVNIYDAGIIPSYGENNSDFVYFIIEYVPGGDLSQYMYSFINNNMLIPISWILYLIKHISLGLSFLHSSYPPIVHGDIKPSNVLLSFNSQEHIVVKLSDFGFSSEIHSRLSDSAVAGTVQFMAPECFKKKKSPSADIYALGVIFYILLTNRFPYDIQKFNIVEILEEKPWRNPLVLPSEYNKKIPSALDDIVMKCLAFNYQDRFLDANELLNEIEEYIENFYEYDKNIFHINNTLKKAFRLALYENNLQGAIDIIKGTDMMTILEEVVSSEDRSDFVSNTIKVENLSNISNNG